MTNQWVSVGERAPEKVGFYWCFLDGQPPQSPRHQAIRWKDGRWWIGTGDVTHWMDLPPDPGATVEPTAPRCTCKYDGGLSALGAWTTYHRDDACPVHRTVPTARLSAEKLWGHDPKLLDMDMPHPLPVNRQAEPGCEHEAASPSNVADLSAVHATTYCTVCNVTASSTVIGGGFVAIGCDRANCPRHLNRPTEPSASRADRSVGPDPGIPVFATLRGGINNGIEETHLECRFKDGQKYAAVVIDEECQELAALIMRAVEKHNEPTANLFATATYFNALKLEGGYEVTIRAKDISALFAAFEREHVNRRGES